MFKLQCFFRNTIGQSLVEFSLVLPIFLFLIMGLMDFSWFSFSQLELTNATQVAARYYALNENIGVDQNAINLELKKIVLRNVDTIPAKDIVVTSYPPAGGSVRISVTGQVPTLTHFLKPIPVVRDVTMMTEY